MKNNRKDILHRINIIFLVVEEQSGKHQNTEINQTKKEERTKRLKGKQALQTSGDLICM